jgi:hypothetical protein
MPELVKAIYQDEVRLLSRTKSIQFCDLIEKIVSTFHQPIENLRLSWTDEDGDKITIATEEDWIEASRLTDGNSIRIHVNVRPTPTNSTEPATKDASKETAPPPPPKEASPEQPGVFDFSTLIQQVHEHMNSPETQQKIHELTEHLQGLFPSASPSESDRQQPETSVPPFPLFHLFNGGGIGVGIPQGCPFPGGVPPWCAPRGAGGAYCPHRRHCQPAGSHRHPHHSQAQQQTSEAASSSGAEKKDYTQPPPAPKDAPKDAEKLREEPPTSAEDVPKVVPRGNLLPDAPLVPGSFGPGVEQLQQTLIDLGIMPARAIRWRSGFYARNTLFAIASLFNEETDDHQDRGIYTTAIRERLLRMLGEQQQQAMPTSKPSNSPPTSPKTVPVEESKTAPSTPLAEDEEIVYDEKEQEEEDSAENSGEESDDVVIVDVADSSNIAPTAPARAVSEPLSEPTVVTPEAVVVEKPVPEVLEELATKWKDQLTALISMGFTEDRARLVDMLEKHHGAMPFVVADLLN